MRKITTLVVVAAATVATPALAQDGESAFAGPYLGAYAGYDKVAIKDIAAGDSESKDGVAFGGIIGYNVDLNSTVIGIEAEIGDASTNESATDLLVAGDEIKLAANLDLFVGARLGLKASPKTLVYLKAGYAVTKATLSVRRQNIWRNSRRRLAEWGPRLRVDVRRRACGAASADVRWSVA